MSHNSAYLEDEIKIEKRQWDFTEDELFQLVFRKNKKRHFLFASKVIGKYIAVHPYRSIIVARLLAMLLIQEEMETLDEIQRLLRYWNTLPSQDAFEACINQKYPLQKKTLFIGFAETATGLGHGVLSCFSQGAAYLHTTRIELEHDVEEFKFYEEHSHAMNHRCYIRELNDLVEYKRIVLIDDEITTGNTALNLIRTIVEELPIEEFVVLSLLDWRNGENQVRFQRLEEELGISIKCHALLKGQIKPYLVENIDALISNNQEVKWQQQALDYKELIREEMNGYYENIYIPFTDYVTLETRKNSEEVKAYSYMKNATGRFGITAEENRRLEEQLQLIGQELRKRRNYKKCLCLGTEEFIYIPNLIACFMGEDVYFESSGRSPIIAIDERSYALKNSLSFRSPEDLSLPIYLYNIENKGYEEVFWFLERDVDRAFKYGISKALYEKGIKKVHFVILNVGQK